MKKALITGGAGFIGSNLADKLVEDGYDVTIVDDLSMGLISNIPDSEDIHFYKKSITDYTFMEKILIENNFDYIYLLAAIASVADTIERPYSSHLVNQEANIRILEVIRKNKLKPKRVIFLHLLQYMEMNLRYLKEKLHQYRQNHHMLSINLQPKDLS